MEEKEEPQKVVINIDDSNRRLSSESKIWIDYALKVDQEQPSRLEEAAKYLSGTISISFAIFLQLNTDAFKNSLYPTLMFTGIFLWLLSLLATLFVMVPKKYPIHSNVVEKIKAFHSETISWKNDLLKIGIIFYLIALVLTSAVYYLNNLSKKNIPSNTQKIMVESIKIFPKKISIDSFVIRRDTVNVKK